MQMETPGPVLGCICRATQLSYPAEYNVSNLAKHGILSVKQYNTAYVIVDCVMQSLRTRVISQQAAGVIRCDLQQRPIYDRHSLARRSQRDGLRERSRFGTASTKQSVRQTRVNAKPGPGGGVLDRPTVLPGYDNKLV